MKLPEFCACFAKVLRSCAKYDIIFDVIILSEPNFANSWYLENSQGTWYLENFSRYLVPSKFSRYLVPWELLCDRDLRQERVHPFHVVTDLFLTPWKHQKTIGFLMFSGGNRKRPVAGNEFIKSFINIVAMMTSSMITSIWCHQSPMIMTLWFMKCFITLWTPFMILIR